LFRKATFRLERKGEKVMTQKKNWHEWIEVNEMNEKKNKFKQAYEKHRERQGDA